MTVTTFKTDYHLLDVDKIKAVHQYPTVTCGFEVWKTDYSDSYDEEGKFNRWLCWGPFADLVEMLEAMNLMDNKISVEYKNGLFIGFYDGHVTIGTKCWHSGDHNYVKTHEDILEAYKRYKAYCSRRVQFKNRAIH